MERKYKIALQPRETTCEAGVGAPPDYRNNRTPSKKECLQRRRLLLKHSERNSADSRESRPVGRPASSLRSSQIMQEICAGSGVRRIVLRRMNPLQPPSGL